MLEKIESVSNILERKKERYIISNGENKKDYPVDIIYCSFILVYAKRLLDTEMSSAVKVINTD